MRRFTIQGLQLSEKFNIDIESIDFNVGLKNTPLKQTFIEFVNNNKNHKDDKEINEYDFFYKSFYKFKYLRP